MVTRLYFLLAMAIGGFALRYFFEQPYVDHVAPMVLVLGACGLFLVIYPAFWLVTWHSPKERPVHYTK